MEELVDLTNAELIDRINFLHKEIEAMNGTEDHFISMSRHYDAAVGEFYDRKFYGDSWRGTPL